MENNTNHHKASGYFKSHIHYQNFRYAWHKSVNNVNAKDNITLAHHLIYNLLRGKDITTGITPIVTLNRLQNGAHPLQGLLIADWYINFAMEHAPSVQADNLLAPFNETVSIVMLEQLMDSYPDLSPLYIPFNIDDVVKHRPSNVAELLAI